MKSLTNQNRVETISIKTRNDDIADSMEAIFIAFSTGGLREVRVRVTSVIEELKYFKVRLENILCETDVKEQVHQNLIVMLNYTVISMTHNECESSDFHSGELLRVKKWNCLNCLSKMKTRLLDWNTFLATLIVSMIWKVI